MRLRFASHAMLVLLACAAIGAQKADVVAFDAPSECGSAAAFATRVGVHTGRAITIAKEAPIAIRVVRDSKGFHGTLRVADESGPHERAVDGHTCAEVVEALALVTSIALSEAEPDPPAPVASMSAPTVAPAPLPPAPSAIPVPGLPPPVASRRSTFAVGARFDIVALDGTPLSLGGSLHGEWSRESEDRIAPSIRLEIARKGVERAPIAGSTVSLTWSLAELDACPLRIEQGRLRFDLCALASAGVIAASSTGLSSPSSSRRLWLGAGAALRGRARLVADLYVEVRSAAVAPITRDRLVIDPGIQAYRPAPITLDAGLGLGWYFQ